MKPQPIVTITRIGRFRWAWVVINSQLRTSWSFGESAHVTVKLNQQRGTCRTRFGAKRAAARFSQATR